MIFYFYLVVFLLLGLMTGSFINVCICRIPKEESIVTPRSHCPQCGALIHWYDNIPLVSYVLLRARCRKCGAPISLQYPLVELVTGIAFALVAWFYPLQLSLPLYLYFTFVLIVISGIDLYHRIIPDVFSYSLLVIGIALSPLSSPLGADWKVRLLFSVIGAATGFGILFLIGFVGEKIMKQEVMGGGDIKLLAGIGAVIGWAKVFSTLMIGSLLGSIIGIVFILSGKMQRRDYLPFGPFLALGAFISLLIPDPWMWLNSTAMSGSWFVKLLLDKL
jgi:leader peptidase (prepilin peptidase)/N-methyltransferase